MTPEEKLTKARVQLICQHAFWGALTMRSIAFIDPTCETAWTDGTRQGYNPDFLDKLSMPEIIGLVAHETAHDMLAHSFRRQHRNPDKFNRAADHVINLMLLANGFELPPKRLADEQYKGLCTETVYNRIPSEPEDSQGENYGDCGEVRDGKNEDGSAMSPAQAKAAENDMKIAVRQAATAAQKAGNLPSGIESIIDEIMQPRVPWEDVLAQFVDVVSRNDYSYRKPNRRAMANGVVLPTPYSNELQDLIVLIDTSGSIGHVELCEFGSELSSILESFNTTVHVVYVDTQVAGYEEFSSDDLPLTLHAKGGGGTDLSAIETFLEEYSYIDPAAMIIFSDGYVYGSGPENGWPVEQDFPVITVLNHDREVDCPDWMQVLPMV